MILIYILACIGALTIGSALLVGIAVYHIWNEPNDEVEDRV